MLVNAEHPENAPPSYSSPIVFNCDPFSKVTVVKDEHPLKAYDPIVSTLAGISTVFNRL